eukprot:Gregarina_sp_Poly_1__190@NODE_1043_length_5264_cov_29_231672_g723_i0_p10_GENE_NODE_1043_length_5264_cov_29_231672_g723_i0NODE_1043_length_5264_cov_29_231672_g723_i0_p10_ORF_typecomplete_len107_score11_22FH2/PF02181_23/6_1e19_NODE_1043_length_5264_cov_29_231672_g723_i037684088
MMTIPNMKDLMMAHKFALEFASEVDSIILPLEKLLAACRCLVTASKFLGVLQVLLRTGNTLNGERFGGFRLTSLPKFQEMTTSTLPKRTMVQYVVDVSVLCLPVVT